MLCKICGQVKNDWGNGRMCRECWQDLHNDDHYRDNDEYYDGGDDHDKEDNG
ncbi:MAG: hypothetical protein M0P69_01660 [Bacteroidales bacterium]|nr:hypothetical protein [Bacteroidales bacterium]